MLIESKEMIIIVQKVETDRAKPRKINQNYVCVLILQGQNTVNRYNWQTGTNKKKCVFTPFISISLYIHMSSIRFRT